MCEIFRIFSLDYITNSWATATSSQGLLGSRTFFLSISGTIDVILPDMAKAEAAVKVLQINSQR